jgi:hypothetical protein
MNAAQLATLRNELLTDPLGRSYGPMTDAQAATSLNTANRAAKRTIIPARDIIGATVPSEWAALTAAEKQRYQTITGAGDVDTSHTNVQDAFLAMFANGTTTRANLIALRDLPNVSRATELGLPPVGAHHVAAARA